MNLIFKASEILSRGKGLTFDDVLIVPNHSEIHSRKRPILDTKVTRQRSLEIPLVSSNMDTVTEKDMACAMASLGGLGILHRFMPIEEQVKQVLAIREYCEKNQLKTPLAASIGVKEEGRNRAQALIEAGVEILTIDIAHGDSVMMVETLDNVKQHFPHVEVIAGNLATPEAARRLIEKGADGIKVGIGPGSMCTTRVITGCGVPQLSAVALCVQEARESGVPVMADGGVKNSGDIVKALAAGASSVMLGSLLAATMETPGEIKAGQKKYRGMASKDAQVSWRGELPKGMAPEGVDTMIPCKGSVVNVVNELVGGIRSGMTYINAQRIDEINSLASFMEMSGSGMSESRPHGLSQVM